MVDLLNKYLYEIRAAIGYYEDEIRIFLKQPNLRQINDLSAILREEFPVGEDQIKIVSLKSSEYTIALSLPPSIFEVEQHRTEDARDTDDEISYVPIDNYEIKIDKPNDTVFIRYKPNNQKITLPLSKVRKLYDLMPEKFGVKELFEKAGEAGLALSKQAAGHLIRVFSHVEFNADVRRDGNKLVAVKIEEGYLREENRRKLKQELEVIGRGVEA
ncbi:hypothetical protein Asulf_01493 [Archaeoglobus sulfaticallidus PM70-1]|uniref:Uncharacterized protein n=1 Tax=Archaeoglobus sulfaticallidus PM70-1 TaxID=387631 RepID=N0BLR1_9EURY|nr:hypothetical protein [Archaeoglobus sulfaticallidus]AGK61476.1 hypothetical protein Asulf_01493 [Archaeoglobus sulfaticallidus PM70-1]